MNFSSETGESNLTLSKIIYGQSDKSEHVKMSLKYYICQQKVREKKYLCISSCVRFLFNQHVLKVFAR